MRKTQPRDITINGERFIEVPNTTCESNGAIPECGGRSCHFNRRGECWIEDYTHGTQECRWPYIWKVVSKDGYVLDRDYRNISNTRIDSERYLIDKDGNRYTRATLWGYKKNSKHNDEFIKY